MSASIDWIDRKDALDELLDRLGDGPLAIDTEADSLHHYPEKVCLIQLSDQGQDFLIDPLAELDLQPLFDRLADPSIETVFHGADYDLRMLDRGFDARVCSLFDTMVAARLCGEEKFGLGALLEKHFDVRVDKKFQRADWSQRPLTPEMANYAALDTRHLVALRDLLWERLGALGRQSWASEEFERLETVRAAPPIDPAEGYQRVKGAHKLEGEELAILRELWMLREEMAIAADRPPFRILHDEKLLEIAMRMPSTHDHLHDLSRLPPSWRSGRRARQLLDAVRRGREVAPDERPRRVRGKRPRMPWKNDPRIATMREIRDRIADKLSLDPGLVAPRSVLEQMLERLEQDSDPSAAPDLRRWQWGLLEPEMKQADLSV